ncbi:MAG: hypothetical protein JEY71_09225 [Sphaerochaeta sp.]|nr:hypothetical protein [Sphaerochaeta sp.]
MRKRALLGILGIFAMLVCTSCATSIKVRHLIPSEVNVSNHRNIAIASTEMYVFPRGGILPPWIKGSSDTSFTLSSGFDSDVNAKIAEASTIYLSDALVNTDYFTILPPETTDAYLTLGKGGGAGAYSMLIEQGVQALLKSSITYMGCEEQVIGRDIKEWVTENPNPDPLDTPAQAAAKVISYEKVTGRSFYLEQKATLTFTYTLIDLKANRILATDSFTSQKTKETCLGKTIFGTGETSRDTDERCYSSGFSPSFFPLFDGMIREIPSQVAKQLAPSWDEYRVSLMSNKPKADVAYAYKLAEQGNLRESYEVFFQAWEQSAHLPSGYNAALLLEGFGQYSEALALMNQVYNSTGNSKSHDQLIRLKEVASQQDEAMKQIDGTTGILDGHVFKTQILTME